MSRFFSSKYSKLVPYTPGEQPKDMEYVKLNTNESPYAPSENVYEAVKKEAEKLHLYSDPEAKIITEKIAKRYGVDKDMVLVTNGSDEVLNFAFMAYGNTEKEMLFPEISYGFYPVFADLNGVKYRQVPLKDDFTIDPNDYIGKNTTVVIANPNAPTGLALSLAQIEEIVKSSPNNASSNS